MVDPIVWKMNEDNRLRSLMFTMTYMLMKRRRDVNNINIQRRNEIQRRVRHRQYFLQRQKRMLMVRRKRSTFLISGVPPMLYCMMVFVLIRV